MNLRWVRGSPFTEERLKLTSFFQQKSTKIFSLPKFSEWTGADRRRPAQTGADRRRPAQTGYFQCLPKWIVSTILETNENTKCDWICNDGMQIKKVSWKACPENREALKIAGLRRVAPVCAGLCRSAPVCAGPRRSAPVEKKLFITIDKSYNVFRRLCCSLSHSWSQKFILTYYFHQNRPLKIGRIVDLD